MGEILAGLILGRSVLGQLAPGVFEMLFPSDPVQLAYFEATAQIGILFLLLSIGLEVDVASAWKLRRHSLGLAMAGVVIPLGLGAGAAWTFHAAWAELAAPRAAFALLIGAAVSIPAITVVARLLFDLGIAKSDLGLLLLSAVAINDLLGWAILAMVLSLTEAGPGPGSALVSVTAVLVFTGLAATLGRTGVTRALRSLDARGFPSPATPLSAVVCLGLACGIATRSMGVHPVFGFLVAGLMAGDRHALSEHTRSVITQMVESIFVPLFFASICLHLDLVAEFVPGLVIAITLLSVLGKLAGTWLGALLTRLPRLDRLPIALAYLPGGPMGILLAVVAREQELIGTQMFVAIVSASIFSSVLAGPGLAWCLHRRATGTAAAYLSPQGVLGTLRAENRFDAIDELCERAAPLAAIPAERLRAAVRAREDTMGTGMGRGIAVPHARIEGLELPLVLVARSIAGLDWDAIDDQPAHLVFLVLTPADDAGAQLEILAAIARGLDREQTRSAILRGESEREILALVRTALSGGGSGESSRGGR